MTPPTLHCWNCNHNLENNATLFCEACGSLQPPSKDVDHFTRLGLAIAFEQGMHQLEQAYFTMQNQLHPDRFVNKSDKEKTLSVQQTMSVNESYDIVKNPLKRAEYLLSLHGIIVNKDNATVKPSQELLMKSLEARSKLETLDNPKDLLAYASSTADKRMQCITAISAGFKENNLEHVAQEVIHLRYLEKLQEDIKQKSRHAVG